MIIKVLQHDVEIDIESTGITPDESLKDEIYCAIKESITEDYLSEGVAEMFIEVVGETIDVDIKWKIINWKEIAYQLNTAIDEYTDGDNLDNADEKVRKAMDQFEYYYNQIKE